METAFTLIKTFLPYGISAIIGASIAWVVQGNRIDHAKLETQQCKADHQEYVNAQTSERLKREDELKRASDAARQSYVVVEKQLGEANERHTAYARCVAAGKCGARVQYVTSLSQPTCSVPASDGANGTSADSILASGESAEEKGIVPDCVKTTLRLNYLQNLVEKQPGYLQ